jgi:hypothetical protein
MPQENSVTNGSKDMVVTNGEEVVMPEETRQAFEEAVGEAIRILMANPRAASELFTDDQVMEIAAAALSAVVHRVDDSRVTMHHDQDEINSLKIETRALLRKLQAA